MRKLLALLAISSVLVGCSPKDSPESFRREFIQQLRATAPHLKVTEKGPLELEITDEAGHTRTAFLDNCYALFRANPGEKEAFIQKYIGSLLDTSVQEGALDRNRITPVIKDRPWIAEVNESIKARGGTNGLENVFEDLNDDLIIVYAEDSPTNLKYFGPDHLSKSGIRKDELKSLAIGNLRKLIPPITSEGGDGLFLLKAGGDYDASLILFDEIWTGRAINVKGDYVVAIPARDALLVTGTDEAKGIASLEKLAAEISSKAPYRLSPHLYVYRDGKFERFRK